MEANFDHVYHHDHHDNHDHTVILGEASFVRFWKRGLLTFSFGLLPAAMKLVSLSA